MSIRSEVIAGSIEVVHVRYGLAEVKAWRAMRMKYAESQPGDYAALGPFEGLARAGRIICFEEAARNHGFAEARVALDLEREGYTCWTGVQFFPPFGRNVRAPARRRNTEEVAREFAEQGIEWPKLLQPRLRGWEEQSGNRVRNPDLACLHRDTRKWLFIEVKRGRREKVSQGQSAGLVVLKWLTGGDAQVRRLMSRPSQVVDDPTPRSGSVTLTSVDERGRC